MNTLPVAALILLCYFNVCVVIQGCVNLTNTLYCDHDCNSACKGTGKCSHDCLRCKIGYFGTYCDQACKGQCLNSNCELVRSGRTISCKEGCKDGWMGLSCNTECISTCTACDRLTGECSGLCKSGYYGVSCSDTCPDGCKECNKENGNCITCTTDKNCGGTNLQFQETIVETPLNGGRNVFKMENIFIKEHGSDGH